ncbi:MAG: ABC transporter permease, partial [Porticoccaceae bacterium]|nr:ABC transporter permease [Porticoccaceae bacterium]
RWQLLLGKMVGLGGVMAFSTTVGFGASALVIGLFSDTSWQALLPAYSVFIGSAILLGWVFIAIAALISTSVAEKSKAAGIALICWFAFVLMFDLALLATLVGTQGDVNAELFPWLLLLNPTDIFRLVNISWFADQNLTGLMAIARQTPFSTATLFAALLGWLAAPLALASFIFNRRGL